MVKNFFILLEMFFLSSTIFGLSYPHQWQLNFPSPVTEIMGFIIESHLFVISIMLGIMFFVWFLLAYVIFRFRKSKRGSNISKTTNNIFLEVLWFFVPTFIVGLLAFKNAELIKLQSKIPKSDITLKVVGHQWYWSYQYPEHKNFSFNSYIKTKDELNDGDLRLLSVDNNVVLPVDTNIRLQVTAGDVIHSWGIPAFGVKIDAIPGRLNEAWFNIKKPGIYYGQCYELCGRGHGFMPIVIEAISKEDFNTWIKNKKY